MTVRELADWLGGRIEGDSACEVLGVAGADSAGPHDVAFAAGKKAAEIAAASRAGCLLVPLDFSSRTAAVQIRIQDPRGAFARVLGRFHPPEAPAPGVHASATVADDAQVDAGASIGPGCRVGARSRIGAGTVLHANVVVYHDCEIGDRVVIHAGAVIGADGFGFVQEGGRWVKFPQVGRVRIESDVEIGANSCIDRAALGVTVIGEGTKLDNMVHVGHNCAIGKHVVVAAQTGFSGGVIVEDHAIVGGQVGVGDKARIESRAVIGSGAGILTSKIVHAGQVMWGTPARPLREHLAQLANLARLPALRKEVSELRARLRQIEEKLGG